MNGLPSNLPSAFVDALGWTLLHSVWQIALVAALFGACRWCLLCRSANLRYLAGCVTLVLMLSLPCVTMCILSGTIPGPAGATWCATAC